MPRTARVADKTTPLLRACAGPKASASSQILAIFGSTAFTVGTALCGSLESRSHRLSWDELAVCLTPQLHNEGSGVAANLSATGTRLVLS